MLWNSFLLNWAQSREDVSKPQSCMTLFVYLLGLSGLYNGVTPTIFKQGTNQAIRFFVMESLKEKYRAHRGDTAPNQPVPKALTGLFGIIAGATSVYGNTPLDVIKTRMQVHVFQATVFFSLHLPAWPSVLLLSNQSATHGCLSRPIAHRSASLAYPQMFQIITCLQDNYVWHLIAKASNWDPRDTK